MHKHNQMCYWRIDSHIWCSSHFEPGENQTLAMISQSRHHCHRLVHKGFDIGCVSESISCVFESKDVSAYTTRCTCNDAPNINIQIHVKMPECPVSTDKIATQLYRQLNSFSPMLQRLVFGTDVNQCISILEELVFLVNLKYVQGEDLLLIIPQKTIMHNKPAHVHIHKTHNDVCINGNVFDFADFIEMSTTQFQPHEVPSHFECMTEITNKVCIQWCVGCPPGELCFLPFVHYGTGVTRLVGNFDMGRMCANTGIAGGMHHIFFEELSDHEIHEMHHEVEFAWYAKALASACKIRLQAEYATGTSSKEACLFFATVDSNSETPWMGPFNAT